MPIKRIVFKFLGIRVDTGSDSVEKKSNFSESDLKEEKKESSKKEAPIADPINDADSNKESSSLFIDKRFTETKDISKKKSPIKEVEVINTKSIKKTTPNKNFNLLLDIEMIKGKGEDAPPLLLQFEDETTVVGVADGLGGAGGTIYDIDNEKRSGAFLASRIINTISEEYFVDFKKDGFSVSNDNKKEVRDNLKHHFNIGLEQILDRIDRNYNLKSNVKSKLIKRLPTTFALSYIKTEKDNLEIINYWAGDSRVYALDSFTGLHQLTQDDLIYKGDAYENILNDSRISNCINADSNYLINVNTLRLEKPKIIFAATDGAFNYLQTPVHFEYFLLRTLVNSYSIDDWKDALRREFIKGQNDDITISLTVIGCKTFGDLKQLYFNRYQQLKSDIEKIDTLFQEIIYTELSLKVINEKNDKINSEIIGFEKQRKNLSESAHSIENEISNFELEVKEMEIQKNELEKKIKGLEKNIENSKKEIKEKLVEFEKIKREIKLIEDNWIAFEENNELIDNKTTSNKLSSLREGKEKSNRELWLKYKKQYEKYLKSQF